MSKPLDIALDSLNKSLGHDKAVTAQAYALDSIAASLLVIARIMSEESETRVEQESINKDLVELMIRRFLDDQKETPAKSRSK